MCVCSRSWTSSAADRMGRSSDHTEATTESHQASATPLHREAEKPQRGPAWLRVASEKSFPLLGVALDGNRCGHNELVWEA